MDLKTRSPGIYFQDEAPAPMGELPRMDIAGFAGFAEKGPLNIPVPVEDYNQFTTIFGNTYRLGWNREYNRWQEAYLAPAVQAFFHNGGIRCWVVRIAHNGENEYPAPVENEYPLTGLIGAENLEPAVARARCRGSWSDELSVSTLLNRKQIGIKSFSLNDAENQCELIVLPHYFDLETGDMLEIEYKGILAFLEIRSITKQKNFIKIVTGTGNWFVIDPFSTLFSNIWPISSLPASGAAHIPGNPGSVINCPAVNITQDQGYSIEADLETTVLPGKGEIVYIQFLDVLPFLLPVGKAEVVKDSHVSPAITRISGEKAYWITDYETCYDAIINIHPDGKDIHPVKACKVTFDLLIFKKEELVGHLAGLALSRNQKKRFWGYLPVDEELYCRHFAMDYREKRNDLWTEAAEPRFPLAGCKEPQNVYLPIGMPEQRSGIIPRYSLHLSEPSLQLARDGLSHFYSGLFLDPLLKSASSYNLEKEAFHKYYVKEQFLHGIHSFFPVDEVSLISVPDAVHTGWNKDDYELIKTIVDPPHWEGYTYNDDNELVLKWQAGPENVIYLVQESADPLFSDYADIYTGRDLEVRVSPERRQHRLMYYRIRIIKGKESSPWSITLIIDPVDSDFKLCESEYISSPELDLAAGDVVCTLTWNEPGEHEDDLTYILEKADDPLFNSPDILFSGKKNAEEISIVNDKLSLVVERIKTGATFYRIRAKKEDTTGPWSNTKYTTAVVPPFLVCNHSKDYSDSVLLDVQRSLLRMCAARGDLFAVLSLPYHYLSSGVIAHLSYLSVDSSVDSNELYNMAHGGVIPLLSGEEKTLRYAALYHPWCFVHGNNRQENKNTSPGLIIPPEGIMCGIMASQTLQYSAWHAPANIPFKKIIGLRPDENYTEIQAGNYVPAGNVNIIQNTPRGFLCLSAFTLSSSRDYRQINVRRLMILLRRLLLREGNQFIFQSNNEQLQFHIKNRLNSLLETLYVKGAFSGNTSSEAFQVVIDQSLNTKQSIESGKIIAEVKVAPSRPLEYIVIRLIQTDLQALEIEEV